MSGTAEFSMIGVAGRRLRMGQWHREATGRRPLVLLNGIGMNIELLEPVARELDDRRIISIDMPGIGKSPDPVFPYTIPCMALTLATLLDRLRIDRADIAGISWGGAVAQQFAFQHRAKTGGLILAATASGGATMVPANGSMFSHLVDPMEYTVERALRRNLASLYNGGGRGSVSLNAAKAPSPLGWACQMTAFGAWSSVPFLPLISPPTLIMADEDDQLIPPANSHFLHNAIPGSQLEMFRGGGHLFMLSDPVSFGNRVRTFLDAAASKG
ncbi:alpha/beta fold hydrolase [Novosphingobium sp.]|uniref:alpha/beta fold hydrolase n=1 Tax=Novosphingobium sp. TaxID=1874826 RepID=UPI00352B4609